VNREEWNRRYQEREFVWSAEPNRFVVAELAELPPGRALDLGAGEGRNAVWLAERGWQVTAVDFAAAGLAKGRELARAREVSVDWVLADLRGYQPPRAAFQLVLIAYLHLPSAERSLVLGRAAAALAPGGTLLVIGHDLENVSRGTGGPQDPELLYTPSAVVDALPGLTVERAERVRRPVDTGDGVVDAIDTLVRAIRA
jgi:SAM-dependent methyltransferase